MTDNPRYTGMLVAMNDCATTFRHLAEAMRDSTGALNAWMDEEELREYEWVGFGLLCSMLVAWATIVVLS
jgi:hypothetical protein